MENRHAVSPWLTMPLDRSSYPKGSSQPTNKATEIPAVAEQVRLALSLIRLSVLDPSPIVSQISDVPPARLFS